MSLDAYFWMFVFLSTAILILFTLVIKKYQLYGIFIAGILASIAFVRNPFYFLILLFIFFPFSYLLRHQLGFSLLRTGGIIFTALAIPALLWHQKKTEVEISSLGFFIFGFVVMTFVSLLAIIYTEIKQGYPFYGALLYMGNAVFYLLIVKFVKNSKKLKITFWVLFAVIIVESMIAFFNIWKYKGVVRLSGTVGDPNYFGYTLLPFAMFSLNYAWGKRLLTRLLFFFIFVFLSIVISITFSRGMILALVVSLLIFALYKKKFWISFVIVLIIAVMGYLFLPKELLKGFTPQYMFAKLRVHSIIYRMYFAKTALKMFMDYPLIGVGADNFKRVFPMYNQEVPPIALVVHNSYLEILSGTGLLGFSFFMAVIYFTFKNFLTAIEKFSQKGKKDMKVFTEGIMFAFIGVLLAAITLNIQHHLLFWYLIATSTILKNSAESED